MSPEARSRPTDARPCPRPPFHVRTVDRSSIVCSSHWAKGSWTVVITRALTLSSPATVAQLYPGARTPYGVAIWEGGNQERAGIKSFTLSREDLILDPAR